MRNKREGVEQHVDSDALYEVVCLLVHITARNPKG